MAIKVTQNGSAAPSDSMMSDSTATQQQRWNQLRELADAPLSPGSSSSALSSPPTTLLPASEMKLFGATPTMQAEEQVIVKCPDCDRPLFQSAMPLHVENCKVIKERKALAAAEAMNGGKKRRLSDASEGSNSPVKKPKPTSLVVVLGDKGGTDSDGSKSKKKKDKDREKDKHGAPIASGSTTATTNGATKAKKPKTTSSTQIDVDRQCGVITDKGLPCPRSLTCKTHSMGAKRSVPHRTQPYDILLHEHQKATKPETFLAKRPVQPRVGPGSEAWEGGKKRKKGGGEGGGGGLAERKKGKKEKVGMLIVGEWEESDAGEGEEALIDSEDEVESVLKGLEKARGRPISVFGGGGDGYMSKSLFVGRNMRLGRLREVLGGVFGTVGTGLGN